MEASDKLPLLERIIPFYASTADDELFSNNFLNVNIVATFNRNCDCCTFKFVHYYFRYNYNVNNVKRLMLHSYIYVFNDKVQITTTPSYRAEWDKLISLFTKNVESKVVTPFDDVLNFAQNCDVSLKIQVMTGIRSLQQIILARLRNIQLTSKHIDFLSNFDLIDESYMCEIQGSTHSGFGKWWPSFLMGTDTIFLEVTNVAKITTSYVSNLAYHDEAECYVRSSRCLTMIPHFCQNKVNNVHLLFSCAWRFDDTSSFECDKVDDVYDGKVEAPRYLHFHNGISGS